MLVLEGILAGQPETFSNDIGKAVLIWYAYKQSSCRNNMFLLSTQSEAINGQNIIVDDGWSL